MVKVTKRFSQLVEKICHNPSLIISISALFLSIFTLCLPYLLKTIKPLTKIKLPDEIQFKCITYKEDEEICEQKSNIKLTADLFSIWNDSTISTKPEVLQKIYAVVCRGTHCDEPSIFKWKYFTETLDNTKRKSNVAPMLVSHNSLRNIEVEFYQQGHIDNSNKNEILYDRDEKSCKTNFDTTIDYRYFWNWEEIKNMLVNDNNNDYVSIRFCLDLEHDEDRYFKCELRLDKTYQNMITQDNYSYNYFINNEPDICDEFTEGSARKSQNEWST